MLDPVVEVVVTEHALERYRERFDPLATPGDIAAACRWSDRSSRRVWRALRRRRAEGHEMRVAGGVVFVVAWGAEGRTAFVLTVLPLSWAGRRAV